MTSEAFSSTEKALHDELRKRLSIIISLVRIFLFIFHLLNMKFPVHQSDLLYLEHTNILAILCRYYFDSIASFFGDPIQCDFNRVGH